MKFTNPLRWLRRQKDEAAEKIDNRSLIERVWDAPVDFNRETRRRARLFSDIWRWDVPAPPMLPRYARRHAAVVALVATKRTRRERRHYARITRELTRLGLA